MITVRTLALLGLALAGATHAQTGQTQPAASPAQAQETLAQREYWANQMDYTQRTLDSIRSTCGGEVGFVYDRASWWAHKEMLASRAQRRQTDAAMMY